MAASRKGTPLLEVELREGEVGSIRPGLPSRGEGEQLPLLSRVFEGLGQREQRFDVLFFEGHGFLERVHAVRRSPHGGENPRGDEPVRSGAPLTGRNALKDSKGRCKATAIDEGLGEAHEKLAGGITHLESGSVLLGGLAGVFVQPLQFCPQEALVGDGGVPAGNDRSLQTGGLFDIRAHGSGRRAGDPEKGREHENPRRWRGDVRSHDSTMPDGTIAGKEMMGIFFAAVSR